jgi:hypothetical protein
MFELKYAPQQTCLSLAVACGLVLKKLHDNVSAFQSAASHHCSGVGQEASYCLGNASAGHPGLSGILLSNCRTASPANSTSTFKITTAITATVPQIMSARNGCELTTSPTPALPAEMGHNSP